MSEGQQRQSRIYSKAKSRAMFAKIKQSKRANQEAAMAAQVRRTTDEFETAKLALQRRGIIVFGHAVQQPGCDLIVVGQRLMTRDEVIAHAERYAPTLKMI